MKTRPVDRQSATFLQSSEVVWTETGDPEIPYRASVNGEEWALRLNDFPDEHLFTLLIEGRETQSLDDLPDSWRLPQRHEDHPPAKS